MKDIVTLAELRGEYLAMRHAHIDSDLRRISAIPDEVLKFLSQYYDAAEMIRWLCTAHPQLCDERPLDRIAALGERGVSDVLSAASQEHLW